MRWNGTTDEICNCLYAAAKGLAALRTMFVGAAVGDGVPDVPVCEANNHRRWFQKYKCLHTTPPSAFG